MIEGIKNCAYSICAAAIFGSIMYYILPEGSLSKLYKIIFGVFFLCCIVSPVINSDILDGGLETELMKTEDFSSENIFEDVYGKTKDELEKNMISETAKILDSFGVIYTNIIAEVNISESGGINIERFEVASKEPLGREIITEIKNRIGIAPVQDSAG